jgi:hypothetical protein
MEKEKIELLKRVGGYVEPRLFINAVHNTPAQSMRDAADQFEAKERDLQKFWELIKELEVK